MHLDSGVFTRFELRADGADIGVYGRKRALLQSPHWVLEDTAGSQLIPELEPAAGEIVFVKRNHRPFSARPYWAC